MSVPEMVVRRQVYVYTTIIWTTTPLYTLVANRMHDSTICYCRRAALPVTSKSCSKQLFRQCFLKDNYPHPVGQRHNNELRLSLYL